MIFFSEGKQRIILSNFFGHMFMILKMCRFSNFNAAMKIPCNRAMKRQARHFLSQQSGSNLLQFTSLVQFTSLGRSEGTSSVSFGVLIINCYIYFINSFIFNCLTLNLKLFIFKLFDVKFLFSEYHVFRKQKITAVYGVIEARPQFRIINSLGK